jgi:hypothetical protein
LPVLPARECYHDKILGTSASLNKGLFAGRAALTCEYDDASPLSWPSC